MLKKKRKKEGPFIATARAKRTPGRTVRVGGVVVIEPKKEGQEPITFEKGGLHKALHVPYDQPIPEGKKQRALTGKYGRKIQRQAIFAFLGALAKGRETLRRRRWRRKRISTVRRPEPEELLYR